MQEMAARCRTQRNTCPLHADVHMVANLIESDRRMLRHNPRHKISSCLEDFYPAAPAISPAQLQQRGHGLLPACQAVTHGCSGCGLRRRTCCRGPLLIACESNFTLSWPRLPSGAHNSSDERRGWPVADAGATAQAGWRWILGRTAGLFLLPQLVAGGPFCLVAGRRLDRNGCSSGRRFPGRPSCLSGPPHRLSQSIQKIRRQRRKERIHELLRKCPKPLYQLPGAGTDGRFGAV